ncbi:MAG TPA: hypothetical protein VJ440_14280, partial [Candidatus Brocadiaceae bacterium]|nr:hypothetical protein [Candidatus Brocadiaceae bacterium]
KPLLDFPKKFIRVVSELSQGDETVKPALIDTDIISMFLYSIICLSINIPAHRDKSQNYKNPVAQGFSLDGHCIVRCVESNFLVLIRRTR